MPNGFPLSTAFPNSCPRKGNGRKPQRKETPLASRGTEEDREADAPRLARESKKKNKPVHRWAPEPRFLLRENHGQAGPISAINGAKETAFSTTIDLVITDVVLPGGMNGRELAGRLREDRPELRILFMSGYTSDAIVHRGVLTQELAFIQKPFSPTGLAARVRELLDEREPPAATTRGDGPK